MLSVQERKMEDSCKPRKKRNSILRDPNKVRKDRRVSFSHTMNIRLFAPTDKKSPLKSAMKKKLDRGKENAEPLSLDRLNQTVDLTVPLKGGGGAHFSPTSSSTGDEGKQNVDFTLPLTTASPKNKVSRKRRVSINSPSSRRYSTLEDSQCDISRRFSNAAMDLTLPADNSLLLDDNISPNVTRCGQDSAMDLTAAFEDFGQLNLTDDDRNDSNILQQTMDLTLAHPLSPLQIPNVSPPPLDRKGMNSLILLMCTVFI